jgi:hypothetical protein
MMYDGINVINFALYSNKCFVMKHNNGWLPFLAGALVGAGIVWLLTSDEGEELLNDLKKTASDLRNKAAGEWDDLKKQASEFGDDLTA